MKINTRGVLQCALFGMGAWGFVTPVRAQQTRLTPAAIGQIVDEVLNELIPPTHSLSGVSVAKRKVVFDRERTMAAFGYPSSAMSLSDLGVRSNVTEASDNLFSDCDMSGDKPCRNLGWSVYVSIKPISVTRSQARVRGYIRWADRGATPFVAGVAPAGSATLDWHGIDVLLARSTTGKWKFVKRGGSIVGD